MSLFHLIGLNKEKTIGRNSSFTSKPLKMIQMKSHLKCHQSRTPDSAPNSGTCLWIRCTWGLPWATDPIHMPDLHSQLRTQSTETLGTNLTRWSRQTSPPIPSTSLPSTSVSRQGSGHSPFSQANLTLGSCSSCFLRQQIPHQWCQLVLEWSTSACFHFLSLQIR